jgi:soluble lytic murein transglycosylase-like protein
MKKGDPHCSVIQPSDSLTSQPRQQKVTPKVAFRWLPVALALGFSLLTLAGWFTRPIPIAAADAEEDAFPQSQHTSNHEPIQATSRGQAEISPIFTPQIQAWESNILLWSEQFNLDPNLIALVMQIESCGHPEITSPAGAMGLFQVMPYHFQHAENPFSPEVNARRGLSYLKKGLSLAKGDSLLALAGYNGGHGVISRDSAHWQEETKRYVYWASGILADIQKDKTHSERLDEWLSKGGASLCDLSSQALGFPK